MSESRGKGPADVALRERLQAALAERYVIVDEMGHGASAVVVAARDVRHFDRDVAIKVIRPEVAESVGVTRFRREMQLVAKLNHPHILPLHDWGEADGLLYYVMPLVQGESLRARLEREKQLPLDQAVRITRDISAALQYAHTHGVVHRDVKPENILLEEGEASLTDFGLARAVERVEGESVTASGIAVGTAAYMSPEQASGGAGDARSDQYSLACVLYEMLAGDPPFHASTVRAMLARHRSDTPAHLTSVRPSLPAGVDDAVLRALAKVPADRFASVTQFAQAVETALTGATLVAVRAPTPPDPEATRGSKRIGRRRWALGTGALVAIAALAWWGIAALNILPGDRAPPLDANRIAVAPFDVIGATDSVWRFGLVHVLSRNLDGAGLLRTVPPNLVVRDWSGRPNDVSARQFARQTGAGLVLYGQLVPSGRDALRLRASILDLSTDQGVADIDLEGQPSQVLQLADSVTIVALNALARSRRIASVAEAGFLTRSLPALKAFLQGEQYYRANNFSIARRHYEMAIAEDTAFAVAYRRLRGVHRALGDEFDSLSLAYAKRAGDLNRGLGRRDSLLIVADSLAAAHPPGDLFYEFADQQRMRRRLQALETAIREYPGDPDARMELAEARYHVGDRLGYAPEHALTDFENAIVREPAFAPAYYHAIQLALTERGADSARQLVEQYLTVLPGDRRFQLVNLLLSPRSADQQNAARLLRELSPDSLLSAGIVMQGSRPIRDRSEAIYRALLARRDVVSSERETDVRYWLANLLLRSGKPAAANVARSGMPSSLVYHIVVPLSYMGETKPAEADSFFAWIESPLGRRSLYALGWFGSRGDTNALNRFVRVHGVMRARDSTLRFRRYVAGAAAAYLSLAKGDTATSLRQFLSLPESLCNALCQPQRIQTSLLLLSSGRAAEAAALLDRFPAGGSVTAHDEVHWRLARARASLAQGDSASARRRYARIVELYEPDNEWSREIVALAKSALARQDPTP